MPQQRGYAIVKRFGIVVGLVALVLGIGYAWTEYVVSLASATVSQLGELEKQQNAYDNERKADCLGEETPSNSAIVRQQQKAKPKPGENDRDGHSANVAKERVVRCHSDSAAIANRIALEGLRSSVASTYFSWLAGVAAIVALLGALKSVHYARRSCRLDEDLRRGRVGITSVASVGPMVILDLTNVGEAPVIIQHVGNASGTGYVRSTAGWAHLAPGSKLTVQVPIVFPKLTVDIRYREYSGKKRRTVVELLPSSASWSVNFLRERE